MSALAPERVRTAPARKPAPAKSAPPRLHLISHATPEAKARRAPKTPFVILLLVLLGGGLLALLLLNTMIDQDAFTLHDLQGGQTVLDVQEAQLHETANSNADPAALAARATALGMVPAGPPVFVKAAKLPKGGTRVGTLYIVQAKPTPTPSTPAVSAAPAPTVRATPIARATPITRATPIARVTPIARTTVPATTRSSVRSSTRATRPAPQASSSSSGVHG